MTDAIVRWPKALSEAARRCARTSFESEDRRVVRQLLLDFVPTNALGDALDRLDRLVGDDHGRPIAPNPTGPAPILLMLGERRPSVLVFSVEQAEPYVTAENLEIVAELFSHEETKRLDLRWEPETLTGWRARWRVGARENLLAGVQLEDWDRS